jgi:hypothetical protein
LLLEGKETGVKQLGFPGETEFRSASDMSTVEVRVLRVLQQISEHSDLIGEEEDATGYSKICVFAKMRI